VAAQRTRGQWTRAINESARHALMLSPEADARQARAAAEPSTVCLCPLPAVTGAQATTTALPTTDKPTPTLGWK